jgi:polyisoprenoid-binding protein YceI
MKLRTVVLTLVAVIFASASLFAADQYKIDKAHSYIGFSVRHLVISNVKGNFTDFDATIMYDEKDIAKSKVMATIKTASVNTNNESRDKHLRSADFFDVEKYPEMIFESNKVEKTEDGYVMHGYLSMLGIKNKVSVPFEILGKAKGMKGEDRIGFEGSAKIKRSDYKMKFNAALETGGLVVGDDINIDLQIEAVKVTDTERAEGK